MAGGLRGQHAPLGDDDAVGDFSFAGFGVPACDAEDVSYLSAVVAGDDVVDEDARALCGGGVECAEVCEALVAGEELVLRDVFVLCGVEA